MIDDATIENRSRKDGQITSENRNVVSQDGNTYTFFRWTLDPARGRCASLTVMDRVK